MTGFRAEKTGWAPPPRPWSLIHSVSARSGRLAGARGLAGLILACRVRAAAAAGLRGHVAGVVRPAQAQVDREPRIREPVLGDRREVLYTRLLRQRRVVGEDFERNE